MDLQNRENFLNKLAAKMGKERRTVPEVMATPMNTHPTERLTHLTQAELCDEFVNFAKVMMVDVVVTSETQAKQTALELCEKYGGGDLVLNDDPHLEELGITQAVQEKYTCHIWSPEQAEANITKSEQANIGIVYAEYGLTESGGIVLFSQAERGRSVSLLPEKSITRQSATRRTYAFLC